MGVFTGSPRSATVVSSQQSAGFTLGKQDVQTLLRNNPDIHVKIQQNIIALLSERLTKADLSIESYADRLKDAEDNYGAG
jgi:CRP-like cAMP-binding protein